MDLTRLKAIEDKKQQLIADQVQSTRSDLTNLQLQETIIKVAKSVVEFMEGHTSKAVVLNQIKDFATSADTENVTNSINLLHETLKTHENVDLSEITGVMNGVLKELKQVPKDHPKQVEQKFVDYTKQLNNLADTLNKVVEAIDEQETTVEAPVVNVEAPQVKVDAPDLKPITKEIDKAFSKAVKSIVYPEFDSTKLEKEQIKQTKLLKEIRDKPVSSGGGGGGSSWTAVNSEGIPLPLNLDANGNLLTSSSGGSGLTDAELRATPVPVSGTLTVDDTDNTATGTISTQNLVPAGVATANSTVEITLGSGQNSIAVQTVGTYTGALTLQGTVDGTNWVSFAGTPLLNANTGLWLATITSALQSVFFAKVSGFNKVRISALAAVTGSVTVSVGASAGDSFQGALGVLTTLTSITNWGNIVDNAAFVDGTTRLSPNGYIFDEVAGTALTENDAAAARVDSKRAQVFTIEDETTRGRRTTVTAANALKVDGSAVTQPVSGTVTTTPSGTQTVAISQSGTDNDIDANITNASLAVTGTFWQATQPVSGTVSETNSTAIKNAVEIMDDWDESDRAKVNPIVGQAGVSANIGTADATTQRIVQASGTASTLNSTTTPLTGSDTFLGAWEDVTHYDYVEALIYTDVSSGTNGAKVYFSDDGGVTTAKLLQNTITGGLGGFTYRLPVTAFTHFKVDYTNGSSAQSVFHLRVVKQSGAGEVIAPLGATVSALDSGGLVRSVQAGILPTGALGNAAYDSSSRQKITVNNFDVEVPIKALTGLKATQQSIATSATQITAAPLTSRKSISIKSKSINTQKVFIGHDNTVTSSTGYVLDPGDSLDLEIDATVSIYAIAETSAQDVCIMEIA